MIDFLANTIGKWQLRKEVKKINRIPEAQNFAQMKSAILVFNITTSEMYGQLLKVVNILKKDEGFTMVKIMGFCSEKEIPNFIDDQIIQCVLLSDIGLTGMPKQTVLGDINSSNYDLMLDFTTHITVPIEYILNKITAKTKVGKTKPETEYIYDLMIDVEGDTSYLDLSKEMIRYLKLINN